jgi:hypothetical protein
MSLPTRRMPAARGVRGPLLRARHLPNRRQSSLSDEEHPMSRGYGREVPAPHAQAEHQPSARYLVLIRAGDATVARLFVESRVQVAEFDAAAEEVTNMTSGLLPTQGASGREWDRALAGHTAQERADAEVYTLQP